MQIILAAAPDCLREAMRFTGQIAHVAYRIDQEGRLSRQNLLRTRGGLMALGDQGCGIIRDARMLCRNVWQECGNRGFWGVAADFEEKPSQDKIAFLESLSRILGRNRMRLFVPEAYGSAVPQAYVLICTAISGGTLRQRLNEAAQSFGQQRIALDLQRLRMSFPLPCPEGEGRPLSNTELNTMLRERNPSIFYSGDLCAKYFTYTENNESRFILFDDADTLRRKMQLGQEMNLPAAFLMYPEVADLLPALFRR